MFEVRRWGGNRNHKVKVLLSTEDEAAAHKRYTLEIDKMRQGRVQLVEVQNGAAEKIIHSCLAPNLRTRW